MEPTCHGGQNFRVARPWSHPRQSQVALTVFARQVLICSHARAQANDIFKGQEPPNVPVQRLVPSPWFGRLIAQLQPVQKLGHLPVVTKDKDTSFWNCHGSKIVLRSLAD